MSETHPIFTPQELANETWKSVRDFEGYYEVSDLGRVKRIAPYKTTYAGKILKASLKAGYPSVGLSRNNEIKQCHVHRLVAEAFIGDRPEGLMINHIDANKQNNRPSNLEYVTPAENSHHAKRLGLYASGDRSFARMHPERLARGARNGANTHPEKLQRGADHWMHRHPERITKGERIGCAVLTDDLVREIRLLHETEGLGCTKLARKYKVGKNTIVRVLNGTTWKHVT
jgi:hypothetical protein